MSRISIRGYQIESIEPMLLLSATVINGTNASEWISGDHNDNSIFAGGGNDEIYAPLGTNTIDGGSGDDALVIYEGDQADYSLQQLANGGYLLTGRGLDGSTVVNTLQNIERIVFNDGTIALNTSTASVPEPATEIQSTPISPSNNITGTNSSDWISGTDGNDTINAADGDDNIYAPIGHNFIDGGNGIDTLVVYEGNLSDYQIVRLENGNTQLIGNGLNGQQVVNELHNVERIHFNDQILNLDAAQIPQDTSFPASNSGGFGGEPSADEARPEAEASQTNDAFIPPAETETTGSTTEAPSYQEPDFLSEVTRLTNEVRAQYGLNPLTVNLKLQQAAQTQSQNLAFLDFFNHTGLDGLQPWDRALNAGYNYQAIGENIAAGQLTAAEVVQAWVDSPSHLANILNPVFTEIGVGFQYLENDTGNINYNYYWTQVFGNEQ